MNRRRPKVPAWGDTWVNSACYLGCAQLLLSGRVLIRAHCSTPFHWLDDHEPDVRRHLDRHGLRLLAVHPDNRYNQRVWILCEPITLIPYHRLAPVVVHALEFGAPRSKSLRITGAWYDRAARAA